MSLRELTSGAAVEQAVEECDRKGRESFLQAYGFGTARRYFLIFRGKRYDSKAIAGVAHGYQFPTQGPLTASMFSGGVAEGGAARRLREMGFEIDSV
jgi:5-methylcytosine-specific restriction protein A